MHNQTMKKEPMIPQDYSWGTMILIGLGVLSIGLAIAYVGFFLAHK